MEPLSKIVGAAGLFAAAILLVGVTAITGEAAWLFGAFVPLLAVVWVLKRTPGNHQGVASTDVASGGGEGPGAEEGLPRAEG